MLLAALVLAGRVHDAVASPSGVFRVEPGGAALGALTTVTMSSRFGSSPAMTWCGAPADSAALALVAEDLDAEPEERILWVVWNIDPERESLPPGLPRATSSGSEFVQGQARDARPGYDAPALEALFKHRLRFTLYAMRARATELDADASPAMAVAALRAEAFASASWLTGGGWRRP